MDLHPITDLSFQFWVDFKYDKIMTGSNEFKTNKIVETSKCETKETNTFSFSSPIG